METPCLLSSLKNISNFLSSSKALISLKKKKSIEIHIETSDFKHEENQMELGNYRGRSICEARVLKFEARIASELSI